MRIAGATERIWVRCAWRHIVCALCCWWRASTALQFVPRILARLLASDGSTDTSPLVRSLSQRIVWIARFHPVRRGLTAVGSIVDALVETGVLQAPGGYRRDYIACLLV